VIEWDEGSIISYAMEPYSVNGWNMNHAHSLPSLRKSVENAGLWRKLSK